MNNKIIKNLKNDFLFLFILEILMLVFSLVTKNKLLTISIGIYCIALFVGYFSARQMKKSAGVIGIIVGILMMTAIITGDIIDFILGIFLLVHSFKYIKSI